MRGWSSINVLGRHPSGPASPGPAIRPGRCNDGAPRGFTLLEALAASAIAAIGLAVLLHTALDGVVAARTAESYQAAMVVARSRLAALGAAGGGMLRDARGHDGGFSWRVRVTGVRIANPGLDVVTRALHAGADRAALYDVTLDVAWTLGGHRRQLHVQTQRLGFVPTPVR